MNRERWFEIAEGFSSVVNSQVPGDTLCARCRDCLAATSVAISLMTASNITLLCASDEKIAALEDSQFMLGVGPSREAFLSGEAVLEDRLASAFPARWPGLATLASAAGVKGIFAFPLQIGAARLGVLTLYQRGTSPWSTDQHADALMAADVLAHVILSMQANAPAGTLARCLRDAGAHRAEVHQASGMLSAQLGVTVAEALVRLRSYAYMTERPVADLALAVIARRLRLERSDNLAGEWSED